MSLTVNDPSSWNDTDILLTKLWVVSSLRCVVLYSARSNLSYNCISSASSHFEMAVKRTCTPLSGSRSCSVSSCFTWAQAVPFIIMARRGASMALSFRGQIPWRKSTLWRYSRGSSCWGSKLGRMFQRLLPFSSDGFEDAAAAPAAGTDPDIASPEGTRCPRLPNCFKNGLPCRPVTNQIKQSLPTPKPRDLSDLTNPKMNICVSRGCRLRYQCECQPLWHCFSPWPAIDSAPSRPWDAAEDCPIVSGKCNKHHLKQETRKFHNIHIYIYIIYVP